MIAWNSQVRLIISDVDETLADIYKPIEKELAQRLNKLLESGRSLFLVSGGGLKRVEQDVVSYISPKLRYRVLLSHCNSSEIWGFEKNGARKAIPYFSIAKDILTSHQEKLWRRVMEEVIKELQLKTFVAMPISEFKAQAGDDPLAIIYDDRGVQITLEVINGYTLTKAQAEEYGVTMKDGVYDLRNVIIDLATKKFTEKQLPIASHFGGTFAINFTLGEVSKGDSIKFLLKHEAMLVDIGLSPTVLNKPEHIEIWGDKFSMKSGKNDWCLSVELDPAVRSISFREENVSDYPKGFNIVAWEGPRFLHNGVLDYVSIGI